VQDLYGSVPPGVSDEKDQIIRYKGFYVARYESGIPDSLTAAQTTYSQRDVSGKPISQKNAIPWNGIQPSTIIFNAQSMINTVSVQSGEITGTQWDTMCKWIASAGKDVSTSSTNWGNYYTVAVNGINSYSTNWGATWTTATIKPANTAGLLKTGNTESTKVKNIYDVAGNLIEMTTEYSSGFLGRRWLL